MITTKHCIAADVTGRDGAKPQWEYSPGQRPGYKCINYLARCKRKRSQWRVFLFPFALTARKLPCSLLPWVLPWAVFLLGFQPVFADVFVCWHGSFIKNGIFYCCKQRRRNQQRNKAENTKMHKWYKETKERRRSDENNEKKCVVILLRFFVKSEVRQLCFSLY